MGSSWPSSCKERLEIAVALTAISTFQLLPLPDTRSSGRAFQLGSVIFSAGKRNDI